ncbi:Glycosyltransferase involved in cell wall bisynthesis [Lachnospiraceae bacterium XBB2008]|nr:Glycosyltransferase involved in cell wall bisynthesis [Lachnospiraceae bacterium XBB2008]
MDSKRNLNLSEIYNKIYNPTVREIGRVFFYLALFLEIVIFTLDRADWINPYQSIMFRITFALFLVKCICTRYSPKEWAFIILTAAFCILAYSVNIRDEIIRAMVFVIAMKDIDVKRALKFNYILTMAGMILLAILALLGVMGEIVSPFGYGEKSDMFMLSLGLGSSNTLGIQIWLFVALGIYLYHQRMSYLDYVLVGFGGVAVYLMTHCRMAVLMIFFSMFCGLIFKRFPDLASKRGVYVTGIMITLSCLLFSVYAAAVSTWWDRQTEFQKKLNILTTGRIMSIYPFENGGGVLSNWKMFSDPVFDGFFDMGIVRLFWWYGVLPGLLAFAAVIMLFIWQYRHKDHAGFVLTLSVLVFSVLEAHFISPFISRAYVLFLIGGMWYKCLSSAGELHKRHIAFYIGSLSKGGAERVFVNLAEYFRNIGYEVTMITQYRLEDEYELSGGIRRVISDLAEEECKGRIYNFFARVAKLHRVIRQTDADLLMTTAGKSNFMAIVCSAFLPTRVVVSVVADPPLEYPTRSMRFLLQTLFGDADGIIMQTDRQRRFLRGGLREEAVILPNSVNTDFIRPRFSGQRKKKICLVGRMDDNKNQSMAISAFAGATEDHGEFRLELCGDGPDRDKLMKLADSLGISDRTSFPGIVSDVPDRLYDAYAFLLTSDTEGMPNTLLEAMSLGVACISTDCPCGGPAQVIKDGENGLLTGVGDTEGLTAALKKIIEDPDLADRLGESAYETMKEYRPEVVNARWRSYFDGIIER